MLANATPANATLAIQRSLIAVPRSASALNANATHAIPLVVIAVPRKDAVPNKDAVRPKSKSTRKDIMDMSIPANALTANAAHAIQKKLTAVSRLAAARKARKRNAVRQKSTSMRKDMGIIMGIMDMNTPANAIPANAIHATQKKPTAVQRQAATRKGKRKKEAAAGKRNDSFIFPLD